MKLRPLTKRPVVWSIVAAAIFSAVSYICFAVMISATFGNAAFARWFAFFLFVFALPGGVLIGAILGGLLALYLKAGKGSPVGWVRGIGLVIYALLFGFGFFALWTKILSPGPQFWSFVVAVIVGAAIALPILAPTRRIAER